MATLTDTRVGNAATPNGWSSAVNGTLGDTNTTSGGGVSTNATNTYDQGWELNAVPADLANVDTLSAQLWYGWEGAHANTTWPELSIRIMNAAGDTVLAAADSGGSFRVIATNITVDTSTASSVLSFNYVNTSANKAAWDDARVEIRITRSRSKGGDDGLQIVYEASMTGTYTQGAAFSPVDPMGMAGIFGI